MKRCSICKQDKEPSEFNKNKLKKDGLQTHCRICSKDKFNRYYNSNKEVHKKETRGRTIENRKRILQYVYDYLLVNPCVDCGETDPRCLEFDHVRGIKERAVSSLLRNNCSIARIASEIEKCDVRCANCHRRKTAIDQNWYSSINKGP